MPSVVLYTTVICPFCVRAKALLDRKGVSYQEINLNDHPELRDEMVQKSHGRRTVPQIFINQRHIGGCDDLYELDAAGKLDSLLLDS